VADFEPAPSYYRASAREPAAWPELHGRRRLRVAVVGAGYAGIATALGLAERGEHEVALIEAGEVGHGASGRNGGFVFGGYSLDELALLQLCGPQDARALYGWTLDAVETIRRRVRQFRIDCAMTEAGCLWVNWFDDPRVLHERQELLGRHFGVSWQYLDQQARAALVQSPRYHDALFEPRAFHVHPLDLARGQVRAAASLGVRVYQHSPILRIERRAGGGFCLHSSRGQIEAEQVVLCAGGYLGRLVPALRRAMLPIATYVMATAPLGERLARLVRTRAAIYDSRFAFDYYRVLADTRLIWGGGISIQHKDPATVRAHLRRDLARVFPDLADAPIDYAWSGWMSYARHQMPQVGQLQPGLWYAQAFGGHGITTTHAVGDRLAAAITDGDEEWRRLSRFGLDYAWRPLGYLGAQASYWWYQAKDAWRSRVRRR
jgi:gamma-glutamylputrescine oxidase